MGLHYPYNWPLFETGSAFFDYFDYLNRFKLLHHPEFFTARGYPFTYMPPGVPMYRFFYAFGPAGGFLVYLTIALASVLIGFTYLRRAFQRCHIDTLDADVFLFLLILTSYPLLFCIERGNLEVVVAAGMALGSWAYWREQTWKAAILWGLFGSVKLYPLLLLALFLPKRQYRQLALAIGTASVTTLLSLLYIGPDLYTASEGIRAGVAAFLARYSLNYDVGLGFDHSLFALLKVLRPHTAAGLPGLLRSYMLVLIPLMLAIYMLRIRKLPVVNQLLFLTATSILLPPTSFDYTLVQMYAPFVALVLVAASGKQHVHGLTIPFVLFALLFTPTNFFSFTEPE